MTVFWAIQHELKRTANTQFSFYSILEGVMKKSRNVVKNIVLMTGAFTLLCCFSCGNASAEVTKEDLLKIVEALGSNTQLTREQILKIADASRGNIEGIRWTIKIVSVEKTREKMIEYIVKAKGFDVHAKAIAPPKDKGNIILMLKGNMWFYKPGLSKAVPISRRQKLLGMAAYGDIASTNYADDYVSTALDEETINGELCYVFDLKAGTKKATYDRIKYWISKKRIVGVKAEYYTVSGKLFKSARMEYQHDIDIEGLTRPFISNIEMRDELLSKDKTVFTFKEGRIQNIPDYIFNLNLLRK